jgi:integrase
MGATTVFVLAKKPGIGTGIKGLKGGCMADIPLLIYYIFGYEAEMVHETAGERLQAWAKAFDDWLLSLKSAKLKGEHGMAKTAWRELLLFAPKLPWEITKEDMEGFVIAQEKTEAARITICRRLTALSNFYKYVYEHQVDRKWAAPTTGRNYLNPAKGVTRPQREAEERAGYLDEDEMKAFLRAIDKDGSIVGKRDYAFFFVLFLTAVHGLVLTRLRWIDVERGEDNAWIHVFPKTARRWREKKRPEVARRIELGKEAWEAIYEYLKESGRWSGMRPDSYVFAPMKNPLLHAPSGLAGDWRENKPMSMEVLKMMIARYAKSAGLDHRKVSYDCIRFTAIVRRLESGEEAKDIQEFLGNEKLASTERLINRLTAHPHEPVWSDEPALPIRRGPNRFKKGNAYGLRHGLYQVDGIDYRKAVENEAAKMGKLDEEGEDKLKPLTKQGALDGWEGQAESIQDEIVKFRAVMDRVFRMMEKVETVEEGMRLLDVYGKAINRLAIVLRSQASLSNSKSEWERAIESVCMEIVKNDEIKAAEHRRQRAALLDGGAGFYADEGESGLRQNGMDMPDVYPGDR